MSSDELACLSVVYLCTKEPSTTQDFCLGSVDGLHANYPINTASNERTDEQAVRWLVVVLRTARRTLTATEV